MRGSTAAATVVVHPPPDLPIMKMFLYPSDRRWLMVSTTGSTKYRIVCWHAGYGCAGRAGMVRAR